VNGDMVDLPAAAAELVGRTVREQSLPSCVTDPAVIRRVAALLGGERGSAPAAEPGRCKDLSAGDGRGGRRGG
jgi:hypothetical protein